MNARTLDERLQSGSWDKHLLVLVCDSESNFECQAAAKFLEILKKGNSESGLDIGFIDALTSLLESVFSTITLGNSILSI